MTCADPIPFETLVALWAGELEAAAAERVEEHVFACDACAASSASLDRLMGSLLGQIPPVLSRALRDRLDARGLRLTEHAFESDRRGRFEFGADLDVVVLALRGDLTDARRVDVEIADPGGQVHLSFANVPFDATRGEVLIACQQHYRDYPLNQAPEFRVYAVGEGGVRRRVGSYVIEHVWL
jgi:hypothetical protein